MFYCLLYFFTMHSVKITHFAYRLFVMSELPKCILILFVKIHDMTFKQSVTLP